MRAGQTAQIVGFDWPALLQRIPEGGDRDRIIALLEQIELGMVEGAAESAKDAADRAKAKAELARQNGGRGADVGDA